MKFFTVKQLFFVLVVLSGLLAHLSGWTPQWRGDGPCLVLRPGGSAAQPMLGLC